MQGHSLFLNFVLEIFSFRLRNLGDVNKSYSCSHSQMALKIRNFSKIIPHPLPQKKKKEKEKKSRNTRKGIAQQVKDFFSKCDQFRSLLRIWSQLLKKSLMENFIFCAVLIFSFCLNHSHGKAENSSWENLAWIKKKKKKRKEKLPNKYGNPKCLKR